MVFENLKILKLKTPESLAGCRAQAKAGLNRVMAISAGGQVLRWTAYKALRAGESGIIVPPAYRSQGNAPSAHSFRGRAAYEKN